jgi:uncharacterized protein (TIGR00299 family) protein
MNNAKRKKALQHQDSLTKLCQIILFVTAPFKNMKILYLDCHMGASGDLLNGALSELVDQKEYLEIMNQCGLEGIHFLAETKENGSVSGTHIQVLIDGHTEEEASDHDHHHHHHEHHTMQEIMDTIDSLNLSEHVRSETKAVYQLLAEAESKAHHMPVSEIHLHEVGMKDAIADIAGCCVLMEMIAPDRVYTGSLRTGSGTVQCAHGILPVPAPAVAALLEGMPFEKGDVDGELLTPTGAALLKHFTSSYDNPPRMILHKEGCGVGSRHFDEPNVLRAYLGEANDDGEVVELVASMDDMTGEEIGYAANKLMSAVALYVYTTQIYMKKNRPGVSFTCMCLKCDEQRMIALMFKHLSTLGIRSYSSRRYVMRRTMNEWQTPYGTVHEKRADGYGIQRSKLEYEDLARIADEEDISLYAARKLVYGSNK